MATPFKTATLQEISPLTADVWSFIFKLEVKEDANFKAGQFITFDLPVGDKKPDRLRSYSIASAPNSTSDVVELCIGNIKGGRASNYFFNELKAGVTLAYRGPYGKFHLMEHTKPPHVFICTGTGVAPIRSILLDLENTGQLTSSTHLIFGCRYEKDILYRKEFEQLQASNPHFKYDICLSRQEDWNGYKGHVHQVYLNEYRDKAQNVSFFICGWSGMVDEARDKLANELNVPKEQIVYELFGL